MEEVTQVGGFHVLGDAEQRGAIFGKMLDVMRLVEHMPKNGNHPQGYKFVSEADAADVMRNALTEVNLALIVGQASSRTRTVEGGNRPQYVTESEFDVAFGDPDTGAMIATKFGGAGIDTQDKGNAKALTSGVKYGLMRTFLVVSGIDTDNPEPASQARAASAPVPRPQRPAPTPNRDGEAEYEADDEDAAPICPDHGEVFSKTFDDGNMSCGRKAVDGNGWCPYRYDAKSGNIYQAKKR